MDEQITMEPLIPGQVVLVKGSGIKSVDHSGKLALILQKLDTSGETLAATISQEVKPFENRRDQITISASDFDGMVLNNTVVVHTAETFVLDQGLVKQKMGVLKADAFARVLRCRIAAATKHFYEAFHIAKPFDPVSSSIPYAGRVFDEREIEAAVDASLDFWLTLGPYSDRFQKGLGEFLGVKYSILVNSGSSANLVAFATLTSPKLGKRRILPGSEVITAAAGFPTTVNPILQYNCIPVFIDSDTRTGNPRVSQLEDALSDKTRAVVMAHTLGNPYDLDAVIDFCRRHDLWLIEDNCDALGSLYKGKLTGSFGDLSTQSFYPPHHLTMGEGGAINVVRDARLKAIVESFRDWGRDCWCDPGKENTCGKRFKWKLGELPIGYDHKYIYSHIGYNLKPLDIQAAIGCEQLTKLSSFIAARRKNWGRLRKGLELFEEFLELPEATPGSEPSWFGFMCLVRPGAPFRRSDIVSHLESHRVQTRMLFGGNLTRQPAYLNADNGTGKFPFRKVGELHGADRLMEDAFFLGVYPGLTDAHLDYMIQVITDFIKKL